MRASAHLGAEKPAPSDGGYGQVVAGSRDPVMGALFEFVSPEVWLGGSQKGHLPTALSGLPFVRFLFYC